MLKLTTRRKEWYPVDKDPSGETHIQILHLKPGEVADIEAGTNEITGRQQGEDFQTEIKFALNDRTKKYVLRSVVDWKGFVGLNQKPLTCSDHNKMEVLKEFDWFGDFVQKCRDDLAEKVAEEEEEAEGN